MDGELVLERRTERDDAGHQVRTANRQDPGEAAATALTDDRDPLAAVLREALEPPLESLGRPLRAVHVEGDAGTTRAMPGVLQPARHEVERLVAGKQPRYEHHRLTVAVGDAVATPDA
jgi:hypothetical protein